MILRIIKFCLSLLLTTILTLLFIFTSFIFYVSFTENGLQNTATIASYLVPGLMIGEAHGKLFSNFTLNNISYYDSNEKITLHSITFNWDPVRLMDTQLMINHLTITGLHIQTFASTAATDSTYFSLEKLKLFTKHASIKTISLTDLQYYQLQKPLLNIENINLQQMPAGSFNIDAKTLGGEINGNFQLSWKKNPIWNFTLEGRNINPGIQWQKWPGKIQFSLSGQGEAQDLKLKIQSISGNLRNQQLDGQLNLQIEKNQLSIKDGKLSIADSYITLSGSLAEKWNIDWDVHVPNLSTVAPSAHGNFFSEGNISGPRDTPTIRATVRANNLAFNTQRINRLTGKINLILRPDALSSLSLAANKIKINDYSIDKIDLNISEQTSIHPDDFLTSINISSSKQHAMNVSLSMPKTINTENYFSQPLVAKINIAFPNLDDFKNYFPILKNPQGTIKGSLDITGTLDNPKASGTINLLNASTSIPKLGITLKNINFQILGNQTKLLTYTGSLTSNKGTAKIIGKTDLADDNFTSSLTVQGSNIEALNLTGYKINITPDLSLDFANKNLSIKGTLTIPEGKINPKDFSDTMTLPSETVFVGQPQPSATSVLAGMPNLDVDVILSDKIKIRYQNLHTVLSGKIHVSKSHGTPPTAVGELYTIKGNYKAYGQTLTIQNGRLIFTGGEINNPGLNITAGRDIRTIQLQSEAFAGTQIINVGVRVLGTLNNPVINLFSNPSTLDNPDILSYLILGVPSSQAQGQKTQLLLAVASSMNIGGQGPSKLGKMTSSLQKSLGLTELNVESVQTIDPTTGGIAQTSSVVVGKQLTKKLYVHSSIGIFDHVPVFNLRYQLSKHWSVQSETSKIDSGGDLLYSIERE